MKRYNRLILVATAPFSLVALVGPAMGQTDYSAPSPSRPIVDADAFKNKPSYDRKKGTIIQPAMVRMIVPGMNKDAVYRIVGPPHFGETITRRFNYVLNLTATGDDPMRCRMLVDFGKPEHQPITSDHTAVLRVVWQTQACADRVVE